METIIASLISAGVTLIICVINNNAQNKATRALLEYRLSQLENTVNKHNMIVERTYKIEQQESVVNEKIKDINRRISTLEEDAKHE